MITKEEINELREEFNKRISEIENKLKQKQNSKRWKPEYRDIYYFINNYEDIVGGRWGASPFDTHQFLIDNCFKTEEEAKEHLENLKTKAELKALAEELNGDGVIDWEDDKQRKFFVFRNNEVNPLFLCQDYRYTSQGQGTIYCLDPDFLDKATERIGEDRLIKMIKSGV